jgi:hypothetical protein
MVKPPVLLTALLVAAFAGCGDDDETSGNTGADRAAIVVTSPKPGQTVSSPVAISGTASVFEGTLQLRVRDASGRRVGSGFATASAGAPERGKFSKQLEFTVNEAQDGVVEAFEQNVASPPESSEPKLSAVEVPVRLEP